VFKYLLLVSVLGLGIVVVYFLLRKNSLRGERSESSYLRGWGLGGKRIGSYLFFGLNLQDRSRVVMREFIYFHDVTLYVTLAVSLVVGVILVFL